MGLLLTTAPSIEPITATEAKAQARVSHTDDDTWFGTAIKAARQYAEELCESAFIDQSWTWKLRRFPYSSKQPIIVPKPPLDSITSIAYLDSSGTSQTWASDQYIVDVHSKPARITPIVGVPWPTVQDRINAVTIVFKAGYGTATTDVPEPIRTALLFLVTHWYENREAVLVGTVSKEIELAFRNLLGVYSYPEFSKHDY